MLSGRLAIAVLLLCWVAAAATNEGDDETTFLLQELQDVGSGADNAEAASSDEDAVSDAATNEGGDEGGVELLQDELHVGSGAEIDGAEAAAGDEDAVSDVNVAESTERQHTESRKALKLLKNLRARLRKTMKGDRSEQRKLRLKYYSARAAYRTVKRTSHATAESKEIRLLNHLIHMLYRLHRTRGPSAARSSRRVPTRTSSGRVRSDGSWLKPHCSWHGRCTWSLGAKDTCAQMMCLRAGYAGGKYVRSSNNPCKRSFTSRRVWAWSLDREDYHRASYRKEAQITADCTVSLGNGTMVSSTGSSSRPHCSWSSKCKWNSNNKKECAQKLCMRAGYQSGQYVRASNDPCKRSYTSARHWAWVMDKNRYKKARYGKEARITARCFGGRLVTSSGSSNRPHCSWSGKCNWNHAARAECAEKLCSRAGYDTGMFVRASNNPCSSSYTSSRAWAWDMDRARFKKSRWGKEAQIKARCIRHKGKLVKSNGSSNRPHCSYSGRCSWGSSSKNECAIRLCARAGYSSGVFVQASNNPCKKSYTSSWSWAWDMDKNRYRRTRWGREAQITARCM